MNEIVFFCENDGHKRKGEKANCGICNIEFIRRLKPNPGYGKKRYCTTACAAKAKQNKVIVKCEICKKSKQITPSKLKNSKHGVYFCGRKCKDFAQSLEGDCKAIQPAHYGTGYGEYSYREKCKKKFLKGCVGCCEKKKYKLVVHHKDGNRKNNKMSNLEVVCYSCHAVRHLKKVNGVWIFDYKVLTPRNKIKELT